MRSDRPSTRDCRSRGEEVGKRGILRFSRLGRKIKTKDEKSQLRSLASSTQRARRSELEMAFDEGFEELEQEEFVYPIPARRPVIDLTSSPPPLARARPARPSGLFPGEGEGRRPIASLNQQNPTRHRNETTQDGSKASGAVASGSGASRSYQQGSTNPIRPSTSTANSPLPLPRSRTTAQTANQLNPIRNSGPSAQRLDQTSLKSTPFATNPAPAQQYRQQQQSPPRRVDGNSDSASNRFQATNSQQPYSQHIPIISSGASARIPSAYLPTASSSTTPRDPIQRVQSNGNRVVPNSTKGKGREVVDLTTSDGEEEDEIIVLNDDPICIGQISTLALILHCVAELSPPVAPIPPPARDSEGRAIPPSAVATPPPRNNQLPVHLYRAPRSGNNETIKIITPGSKEIFGVMEHKTANVVASLLGDGYSGTGVTKGGNGKIWCSAAVLRRTEKDVRLVSLSPRALG